MRGRSIVALLLTLAVWPAAADAAGQCGSHPWCDTSLSPDRRADLLIGALTPAERIGLLAGDASAGVTGAAGTHTGVEDGVPRVGLPPLHLTDGPVGIRQGPSTAFPSSLSLAATFDLALARRDGALIGNEAKLKGNDIVYAPTINLLRTPLWGRAFESLGEDPFLTAQLGVAWIRGLQKQGVIANVKHFAVNNQEGRKLANGTVAGNRYKVDARVDERTLMEMYLPQFEAAVKEGDAGSVMCSYNRLNGPHTCENTWLLQQILRHRWGFKGFVLADYGASKHIGSGLLAGLDFEPFPYVDFDGGENYRPALVAAAIAAHRTTQARVDAAVHHVLRTLFAYRFFDRDAYVDDDSRVDRTGHAEEARRLAEAGTVLLKNKGGVLPFRARKLKSLAIIGADADIYKNGGGSSNIQPYSFVTPRAGIAARAGSGVDVRYDTGVDLDRAASRGARRRRRRGGRRGHGRRGGGQGLPGARLRIRRQAEARRAGVARGRGQPAHGRRARDGRPGADALARPRQGHPRGLVPGQRRRGGDRAGAVRRRRPGRPSAGDVPAPGSRPAHGRQRAPLSGCEGRGPLQRGTAGRLPLVRQAPHRPGVPVRVRALLHALRVPAPADRPAPAQQRRPRELRRRERRPPGGSRGAAGVRGAPGRTRPRTAAAPAQGVRLGDPAARRTRPHALPAPVAGLLVLEQPPRPLAGGTRVLRRIRGQLVARHRAAGPARPKWRELRLPASRSGRPPRAPRPGR